LNIINKIKDRVDIIIVDFHAEATAEKIAMGYFIDGKVTALLGTHTHVATADEQILEHGTAYITDVGMTGPKKSVIGMEVDASIKRFVTSLPERYKVSEDKFISLNACLLEIDDTTCRAKQIERILI
jgi:metallophosphoesterase (TIGR00282 family)